MNPSHFVSILQVLHSTDSSDDKICDWDHEHYDLLLRLY